MQQAGDPGRRHARRGTDRAHPPQPRRSTGCPAPASSSRCCRSPRPRPTPSGCWWSARNWPTCCPRSSAGSAATGRRRSPAGAGLRPPRTDLAAAHARCCSSAASAPRTAGSAQRRPQHAQRRAGRRRPDRRRGSPLHFTPHDFRRIFITDAIMSGLPPHIAQIIAGHRDINVTHRLQSGLPREAIQAHLAFLARRRALRPGEEYRVPTDDEWDEFLGHFERRKVASGLTRGFGTPCIHEHSCVRCSSFGLTRPSSPGCRDPRQPPRPHRRSRTRRLARRDRRAGSHSPSRRAEARHDAPDR